MPFICVIKTHTNVHTHRMGETEGMNYFTLTKTLLVTDNARLKQWTYTGLESAWHTDEMITVKHTDIRHKREAWTTLFQNWTLQITEWTISRSHGMLGATHSPWLCSMPEALLPQHITIWRGVAARGGRAEGMCWCGRMVGKVLKLFICKLKLKLKKIKASAC